VAYTSVFGGNTIYPSDVSYLPLALSADTPLEWPLESSGTEAPAARIIDVTPSASGYSVVLPDATLTGAGQTLLFNNLSGSESFYVKDFAGNTLATVTFGTQWQLYLAVTTTAAGTWRVFRYGASTATVQPSALAGYGLTVTGSALSQAVPVTTFSTTGLTASVANRASAFVWTGSGAGTLNLLPAVTAGNNYFVIVRNEGGGDLTLDPSGTETINNASTLIMRPGDSCTVITDGLEWYTIGLGQNPVFAFDYTSISVTGGTYTLSGSELNRIAYKFVGALTSDVYVVVPSTVQQYWITNATTGAFNFYVQTFGGTPVQVNQNAKNIYYCDGSGIILASDPTSFALPVTVGDGGTGATTASAARLNLGITAFADGIVTATTGAGVRTIIGAAASGANSDITSLSGLTTALSVAQGGTGTTSSTGTGSVVLSSSPTLVTPTLGAASATSITNGLGAAATPSYTFTGDLNTGVWSPGVDIIAVSTGGSERLRVGSTGSVSVGTTSAGFALRVGGVLGDLKIGPTTGTQDGYLYIDNTNSFGAVVFQNAGVTFGTLTAINSTGLFHNFTNHVFRSSASVEYGRFNSSGSFLITGAGGIGYGTGSGGAVTQITSRTTSVTLNKTNGAITLVSAAGTTTWQSFTVNNSTVADTDVVCVSQKSGTDTYQYAVTNVSAGSFQLSFRTVVGTTVEQPVFNFAVIKAVTS